MHRIDADGNVANLFTDGDPAIPQVATQVDAAWLNDLQENVCKAVENAGIALVKGTYTQLDSAILARIAAAVTPTIVTPALAAGANVVNRPKLSYWKDASGATHIEGNVGSLAANDVTIWSAGTLPSALRPSGTMIFPAYGSDGTATRASLLFQVNTDGSVLVGTLDASVVNSFWVSCVFHPSVPHA